ncbi:hypothetical protein CTI12_AA519350 [Artemisia annua]|uniref:Uncharacterized protein n=1 Tax=Artemisia annua TaxID=35608 RepID=A0A2U1L8L9_ARTAN|nr:hypothetical protein CTI12_AA519350 [Artemisia annua]
MLASNCISINRTPIIFCLSDKSKPDTKPQVRRSSTGAPLQPPLVPAGKQLQKKPSVAEIERAIGAGKNILKAVFLWILPLWIISFLVALEVIKIPFISPYLDDLIM